MSEQDARARLEQALVDQASDEYGDCYVCVAHVLAADAQHRPDCVYAAARAYLDATADCAWTEDAENVWQTACGHAWQFNDGGPDENKQRFCGYCGAKLRTVRVPVG